MILPWTMSRGFVILSLQSAIKKLVIKKQNSQQKFEVLKLMKKRRILFVSRHFKQSGYHILRALTDADIPPIGVVLRDVRDPWRNPWVRWLCVPLPIYSDLDIAGVGRITTSSRQSKPAVLFGKQKNANICE